MRSGTPNSLDCIVTVSYGSLALDQIAMGNAGYMAQQAVYTTVPLDMVIAAKKHVDVTAFYDTKNYRPIVKNPGQTDVYLLGLKFIYSFAV